MNTTKHTYVPVLRIYCNYTIMFYLASNTLQYSLDPTLSHNMYICINFSVSSEPTNAIVSRTTHNSTQLKWSAPLQKGGSEIIGYKITFTSLKHSGYYIIGVINTWELVGLVQDSKYNIEISAINRVGIGAPANLTVKTATTGEIPCDTIVYGDTYIMHILNIQGMSSNDLQLKRVD